MFNICYHSVSYLVPGFSTALVFPKSKNDENFVFKLKLPPVQQKFKFLKIRNLQFPAQCHFPAWATNCQECNLHLLQNFQPPWPICQTLTGRWKNASIWNHSVLHWICRLVNCRFPMVEVPFSYFTSPKTQSIDLFWFSILMFTSVQNLVSIKRKKHCRTLYRQRATSSNLGLFGVRRRNNTKKLQFHSTKCLINVNRP